MTLSCPVSRRPASSAFPAAIMLALAGVAQASGSLEPPYDQTHDFSFEAVTGSLPNYPSLEARFDSSEKARARSRICKDPDHRHDSDQPTSVQMPRPMFVPFTFAPSSHLSRSAPGSTAAANGIGEITSITPLAPPNTGKSKVVGFTRAWGSAVAVTSGCTETPLKRRKHSARAISKVQNQFWLKSTDASGLQNRSGLTEYSGEWANESKGKDRSWKHLLDPLTMRFTDLPTQSTQSWTVVTIDSWVHGPAGTFTAWRRDGNARTLVNTAPDMRFELVVGGPVVPLQESGAILITASNGVVTRADHTGGVRGPYPGLPGGQRLLQFRLPA